MPVKHLNHNLDFQLKSNKIIWVWSMFVFWNLLIVFMLPKTLVIRYISKKIPNTLGRLKDRSAPGFSSFMAVTFSRKREVDVKEIQRSERTHKKSDHSKCAWAFLPHPSRADFDRFCLVVPHSKGSPAHSIPHPSFPWGSRGVAGVRPYIAR